MKDNDNIGKRIERIILHLNLTMTSFAQRIKVTQPYISKLIAGNGKPSDRLIDDIAEKFNVNKDWLIYGGPDEDMFRLEYENDELAEFCAEITEGKDPFIAEMLLKYKGLSPQHKEAIWEIYAELTKGRVN